jgi:hypothetical protein|tara:strand:- start:442 stop:630 length:189 start_codon:yes stop_codon:yes gene_type:complete
MANISKTVKEVIREMVDNDELKIVADDYGDLVLEVSENEEEDLDEDEEEEDLDEDVSDKDDD